MVYIECPSHYRVLSRLYISGKREKGILSQCDKLQEIKWTFLNDSVLSSKSKAFRLNVEYYSLLSNMSLPLGRWVFSIQLLFLEPNLRASCVRHTYCKDSRHSSKTYFKEIAEHTGR